jgi:hypothetical protein
LRSEDFVRPAGRSQSSASFEQPGQRQLEAGQHRRPVSFLGLDDDLGRLSLSIADDGHRSVEPVDDPVFADPERQVLALLLLIIPPPVPLAPRDELDDDRGEIPAEVGDPSEPGPDDAIGPTPSVRDREILLG